MAIINSSTKSNRRKLKLTFSEKSKNIFSQIHTYRYLITLFYLYLFIYSSTIYFKFNKSYSSTKYNPINPVTSTSPILFPFTCYFTLSLHKSHFDSPTLQPLPPCTPSKDMRQRTFSSVRSESPSCSCSECP